MSHQHGAGKVEVAGDVAGRLLSGRRVRLDLALVQPPAAGGGLQGPHLDATGTAQGSGGIRDRWGLLPRVA
jgi:hypothetical protein